MSWSVGMSSGHWERRPSSKVAATKWLRTLDVGCTYRCEGRRIASDACAARREADVV
eukprot:CAMPEP_0176317474 /NCGR_PEP_ID=MMETSP0121_2-20121125/69269_1 /TAXON_ID=160619 /ORGANISM="Kryptoperidinium foliaceum, Strain CCMP 1326" /LENGTH=56 /DNA_ID=CAMNT_0017659721 /DNA_START=280 /DNA_END=450 /DNA_ORIENTATION=+